MFSVITVQANGDFVVLHSPDSITFNGDEEVEQSFLKDVLAVALGFTVRSVRYFLFFNINILYCNVIQVGLD